MRTHSAHVRRFTPNAIDIPLAWIYLILGLQLLG